MNLFSSSILPFLFLLAIINLKSIYSLPQPPPPSNQTGAASSRAINSGSAGNIVPTPDDEKGEEDTGVLYDEEDLTLEDFFDETMSIGNFKHIYGQSILDNLTIYNETLEDDTQAHGLFSWLKDKFTPAPVVPDADKVKFYLYADPSRPENAEELIIGDLVGLKYSHFNPSAPIKIICHGWMSNYLSGPGSYLVKPYFVKNGSKRINLILVDWWELAGVNKPAKKQHSFRDTLYFPPARNTRIPGTQTARLIEFLIKEGGAKLENFHLIGHSLGAHAMGWAGRILDLGTNPRSLLPRITALDPAKPCFEYRIPILCSSASYQPLSTDDAKFVDVIHTHGKRLGFTKPLGHADFYPNGGETQPGCSKILSLQACSHTRAVELMAATVTAPSKAFEGTPCRSHDEFETCAGAPRKIKMGEECPTTARGIFYLETGADEPYYK